MYAGPGPDDTDAEKRKKSPNVKLKCHFSQLFVQSVLDVPLGPQVGHKRSVPSVCGTIVVIIPSPNRTSSRAPADGINCFLSGCVVLEELNLGEE